MARKKKDGTMGDQRQRIAREVQAEAQKRAEMKPKEIQELMELKGWRQLDLAIALSVAESTVWRWIEGERTPGGPTVTLLRQWLAEARNSPRPTKQSA